MRYKYRIIEMLSDAPEDIKAMTVSELLEVCAKEVAEAKKEEDEANEKVCSEFKDSYIKIIDEESIFGVETKYIHIKTIEPGSMTTEWKRCYNVSGTKIRFSDNDYGIRELESVRCSDSMMAEELNSAERITEEDFKEARYQLEVIEGVIKKIR